MTTTINKEQKNPNVPNLRFPEFEGEWKRHSLTDFMSFKNGMNPDANVSVLGQSLYQSWIFLITNTFAMIIFVRL